MTNKWNHRIHRMLLFWLRAIGLNSTAHYETATHLTKVDNVWSILLVIFAGLTALVSIANLPFFQNIEWLKILLQVIAAVSSILVIVINQIKERFKFSEDSILNKHAATSYDDLSAYIQTTTILDEKPDPGMFLRTVMDRFRFIQQYGPDLPDGYTSIATLPNLILMKDAQRRRKLTGLPPTPPGVVRKDGDGFDLVSPSDVGLYGGGPGSPINSAEESEEIPMRRQDNIRMEQCDMPERTVVIAEEPAVMRAIDEDEMSSFLTGSGDDSMDLAVRMGLCKSDERDEDLVDAIKRMASGNLPVHDGMSPNVLYIGPTQPAQRPLSAGRRRLTKSSSAEEERTRKLRKKKKKRVKKPKSKTTDDAGVRREPTLSALGGTRDTLSPRERLQARQQNQMDALMVKNNLY